MNYRTHSFPASPQKLISLVFAAALALPLPHAHADNWISAGQAPASNGGGISLAATAKTSEKFGWGLGIVFNGDIAGDDVLDYPVPHNDYANLGAQRTGNAIGLDALWFPAGETAWRPYAGVGLYYDQRAEVARSNVTGWYYTQEDKSALRASAEVGLQYRTSRGTLMGLGYHTIRGAFFSLGW